MEYITPKILKNTIAAGDWHTIGLKSDGTLVAVGDSEYDQCNVGSWSNIIRSEKNSSVHDIRQGGK